jgi:hypothetical protein
MLIIDESDLPAPDTLVRDKHGNISALMFYFAAEEQKYEDIAHANGFETCHLFMTDDPSIDKNHVLIKRLKDGEDDVEKDWNPAIPAGWMLGAKLDTEDGPAAVFIRRKETEDGKLL